MGTTAAAGQSLVRISASREETLPLFSSSSACRSYCEDCLNILVGAGTFDALKELEPWVCFLCQPHRPHGALDPREDWSICVQEIFANNSGLELVSESFPHMHKPSQVIIVLLLSSLGFHQPHTRSLPAAEGKKQEMVPP